jgi:hypothetical protein
MEIDCSLSIHEQGAQPFAEVFGVSGANGFVSSFGLRMVREEL